jgi:hypothetical protein
MVSNTCRLLCLFALLLGHGLMAKTIYVDDNASEGGDGSSWSTAHKYLQDALAVAEYGDEIWVAEGTYKPDQGAGKTAGDRTASFDLVSGVGMYGGFGGTETTRDPQGDNNQTVLSGELSSNSELWSLHIVIIDAEEGPVTIDGFKVQFGNANGSGRDDRGVYRYKGAGIYIIDAKFLKVSNCIISLKKEIIMLKDQQYGGLFSIGRT